MTSTSERVQGRRGPVVGRFLVTHRLTLAYVGLGLVFAVSLAQAIGVLSTLRLVAALVVLATLPGIALVRFLLPRAGGVTLALVGTVVGLGLWSIGGLLSNVTGIFILRWLPVVLALAVWIVRRRRGPGEPADSSDQSPPLPAVVAWIVATLALLPSTREIAASQPASWQGWHSFYVDLGYQAGIASEAAARAPHVYPWAPDLILSYPWLFHSSMGVWSSSSGVAATDIVLVAWPTIVATLIPGLIGIVAWQVTRVPWSAILAPLAFVFLRGIVILPDSLQPLPIYQISPTRDFGNLFALLVVLALARLLSPAPVSRWWYGMLALGAFVATGSKASEWPVMLGGLLCALAMLVVLRRFTVRHLVVLAIFAVSCSCAYLLVLPDFGSTQELAFGPLSFLSPDVEQRVLWSLLIVVALLATIVGIWLVIGRMSGEWVIGSLVAGSALAGLVGLALLKHPGYSQLYFWQSAEPILAIALAWAVALFIARWRSRVVIALLGVFVGTNIAWAITARPLVVGVVLAVLSVAGALFLTAQESGARMRRVGLVVVTAAVLVSAGQFVAVPHAVEGGAPSSEEDPSAIHDTQLAAYQYLRENSSADDLIVTNKHCRTGELDRDCDPRWFSLAAYSERRVLVEGWGYTRATTEPGLIADSLELSVDFITAPSASGRDALLEQGVRFVYIDTREPYSPELDQFGSEVYSSDWAIVYALE